MGFPPLGPVSAADACEALLPHLGSTHAARAARLLLLGGPGSWRKSCFSDGAGRLLVHVEGASAGETLNILPLHGGGAAGDDDGTPARLHAALAGEPWAASTPPSDARRQPAVTMAALSADDVGAAAALLHRLGRATTENVPCATFELPLDVWAEHVGTHGDARVPLRLDALAAELGVPRGYTLGALSPTDAALCASTWAYNSPGAEAAIRASIERLPSACVRADADDGAAGPPVAWIVARYDGSLGVLHTLPAFRGKGLARAVVRLALVQLWRWRAALMGEGDGSGGDGGARPPVDPALPAATVARLAAAVAPFVHVAAGNGASAALFAGLRFAPLPGGEAHATWLVGAAPAPRFVLRPIRAGAAAEWAALTALVNASYRQDDAFFVNHVRTAPDGSELRNLGAAGTFFVGYALRGGVAAPCGLGVDCGDPPPAPTGAPLAPSRPPREGDAGDVAAKPPWESDDLLVSAYVALKPDGGDGGPLVASLSLLTVAPHLKRRGCAQRVLDAALAIARGAGAAAAEVHVVSVKPWLLRFYVRNGFAVVGEDAWPADALGELLLPCFFHRCRRALAPLRGGAAAGPGAPLG